MPNVRARAFIRFASVGLLVPLVLSVLAVSTAVATGVNLDFTTSPPNPAKAGTPFPVTVHVKDNANAPLSGVLVTLDVDPGHDPGGAAISCSSGLALSSNNNGNANFNGCGINHPAAGYQLRARASGAATVTTVTFDVEIGPAAALVFQTYPADPTQPLLLPVPSVAVVDAAGNVRTGDTRTITLSINKHTSTFSCSGGLSKAAVNGVAAFAGCMQTNLDNGYQLTAHANNLPNTTGQHFEVKAGTATHLQFCWGTSLPCDVLPPLNLFGGRMFAVQPVLRVVDANDNTVTSDNSTQVTLSILAGTPTSGGPGTLTCNSGQTRTASHGVAQFSGCRINTAGAGYRLRATSSPTLIGDDSHAFDIRIGPPDKLVFTTQPPATATAGTPFGPITVAITDLGGNVITTGIQATIRLSFNANPGGAALSCASGTDVVTANGVATFSGCTVSNPGQGYRFAANAIATSPQTSLSGVNSSTFTVVPAGITLSLSTIPSNGVIVWGDGASLVVHFTALGGSRQVTLQVSHDLQVWTTIATIVTDGGGNASFPYRPSDNRYYRAVWAGAPDLPAATSATARIVVRQISLLRPTNDGKVTHVAKGTTVHFQSTVRPNRPELPLAHVEFVVYRLDGGVWRLVFDQILPVDSAGIARLDVTFSSHASYYVRSEAVPTTMNANSGWSPVERYDAA